MHRVVHTSEVAILSAFTFIYSHEFYCFNFFYFLFQIEREVILSSSDKNSKIPILNDYIKRTKGAIAPDVPPKQMSAWSNHTHHQILSPDQVSDKHQKFVTETHTELIRLNYCLEGQPR